jgi:diguanylate cyclase (GGDEF)-like protein
MRILIAEDDPVSRRMLEAFLKKWGYDVLVACDGPQAWAALEPDDSPTLAILDWMMPGMDGVQVCRKVRERSNRPYVYIILLTAKGRKQDIIEGIEGGADDYLVKPFDAHELRAHLRAGKRILDLQEELISAREALRVQATHDPLTGLWNHAAIFDTLRTELERASRERTHLGLIMADLDHFKQINDTHGHMAGDTALREVARRLRSAVRPYDAIGRYGGEEFLAVVPGCDSAGAFSQAERLRDAVCRDPVQISSGTVITLTLSMGVAASTKPRESDLDEMLRAADAALYRAKRNGRNRAELADDILSSSPDLFAALERDPTLLR